MYRYENGKNNHMILSLGYVAIIYLVVILMLLSWNNEL